MNSADAAQWLIAREQLYGGKQSGVRRRKVSPLDTRPADVIAKGGMQGGDRYGHHGYAPAYAEAFSRLDRDDRIVIVELGILRGTGLAVLCDYFPRARIIGLDVDLSHWEEHKPVLEAAGAFRENRPEVYEFDELDGESDLRFIEILQQDEGFDLLIDDALHDDGSILGTFNWASPLMNRDGVYFIEDNSTVRDAIAAPYDHLFQVTAHGRLTVVRWR